MQTIRTFIAVPLAEGVRTAAVRLMERVREDGDGIKWVPTDNLHLTLKFLGDVENVMTPQVCEVVRDVVGQFEPFELSFAGAGAFPNLDRPRVFYAGVRDESGSLTKIVGRLEDAYAELGFKREPREYRPHLTLGRARRSGRRPSPELIERLRGEQATRLGEMPVDTVQVMASFLEKKGPSYQVMGTIDLGPT